ncbi:hypothetical protein EYF80_017441 [Liparis tanakae]|uniref:Uncharacterized protein n=1 Tax=Liparis tanakae TaxID=230148 RepID=A0A4Z2I2I3_9TELE|nr:hypothetical protein EYF80_017441 [Liparis tanakae]
MSFSGALSGRSVLQQRYSSGVKMLLIGASLWKKKLVWWVVLNSGLGRTGPLKRSMTEPISNVPLRISKALGTQVIGWSHGESSKHPHRELGENRKERQRYALAAYGDGAMQDVTGVALELHHRADGKVVTEPLPKAWLGDRTALGIRAGQDLLYDARLRRQLSTSDGENLAIDPRGAAVPPDEPSAASSFRSTSRRGVSPPALTTEGHLYKKGETI